MGPQKKERKMTWTEIKSDPTPTEYREHFATAWWVSADGAEMIEAQHTVENPKPCYYRFPVDAPDNGRGYSTLTEAKTGRRRLAQEVTR
jgi:hypothetical protein